MKKFLSILAVLVFTVFCFVGCGKSKYVSMADAPAIGNGGLAVAKGDYIYFVNGYVSKDVNLNKNKNGKITTSGIYRIKTKDCSYKVVGGSLYFNIGDIERDKDGNLVGAQRIVSKVCGFENTALYIFGDYIYYTTPNNEVAKNGTPFVNDIDFCRARLDGKKNTKLGTVSIDEANYAKSAISFYSIGEKIYFVCFDGKQSLSINEISGTKAKEVFKTEGVSEVLLPQIAESFVGQTQKALDGTIFYTKNKALLSTQISAPQEKTLKTFSSSETFAFVGNTGSRLVYSVKENDLTTIYENKIFENFDYNANSLFTSNIFTSFKTISQREEIIALNDSAIYLLNKDGTVNKQISASNPQITKIFGENIFYISSENLYQVNLYNTSPVSLLVMEKIGLNSNIVNSISITNEKVFYFKTIEDGKVVLEMIDFANPVDGEIKNKQILSV